jgi:hypothetical protein
LTDGKTVSHQAKEQSVTPLSDKDTPTPADAAQAPGARQQQFQIDDSKAIPLYANFCRVHGTPEELIVDFGLNPQPPFGTPAEPIPVTITQRIITNYYTAKRMLHALQLTIQHHEAAFGVLETDVQRRVQHTPRPAPPAGAGGPQRG